MRHAQLTVIALPHGLSQSSDKIVVVDIDGTITRTDVGGGAGGRRAKACVCWGGAGLGGRRRCEREEGVTSGREGLGWHKEEGAGGEGRGWGERMRNVSLGAGIGFKRARSEPGTGSFARGDRRRGWQGERDSFRPAGNLR
eukprot:754304-Hanusia_phi.AAC.1